jgi:heme/copper-type cytochrome/quinol oxidase subunit 3
MADAELPTHLLYMLVFGGLVLAAFAVLAVESGARGKRRFGMIVWSVLAGLVGAVFFVINVANVITESSHPGAG